MAEMISKQHLLEQIDTTGKGCEYEGKEFLAYQEAMLAVVELIEKETRLCRKTISKPFGKPQ